MIVFDCTALIRFGKAQQHFVVLGRQQVLLMLRFAIVVAGKCQVCKIRTWYMLQVEINTVGELCVACL